MKITPLNFSNKYAKNKIQKKNPLSLKPQVADSFSSSKIISFKEENPYENNVFNPYQNKTIEKMIFDKTKNSFIPIKFEYDLFENCNLCNINAFVDDKRVGIIIMSTIEKNSIYSANNNKNDDGKTLYIAELKGNKKYQGLGTELMDMAVKTSCELGYKGRIQLKAQRQDSYSSPTTFYYKYGLRSPNEKINEELKALTELRKRINNSSLDGKMYLPEEKALEILSKMESHPVITSV